MSNASRLLDLLTATRDRARRLERRAVAKCARQLKCVVAGAVGHCEEFDPVLVYRAKMEEKDSWTR